jgi:hypothetical protein
MLRVLNLYANFCLVLKKKIGLKFFFGGGGGGEGGAYEIRAFGTGLTHLVVGSALHVLNKPKVYQNRASLKYFHQQFHTWAHIHSILTQKFH